MSKSTRAAWLEAAKKVGAGEFEGIRCPENNDDILKVTWFPGRPPNAGESEQAGEYQLLCPSCGAAIYMRTTRPVDY